MSASKFAVEFSELGEGGGYVVAAVHNIQPDVPAANVVAMIDEAVALGSG